MGAVGVVGAVGAATAVAQTAACYDPASLSFTQKSRRRSLGYVEQSPDAKKRCELCSFFSGAAGGCGTCQMLSGGPVNAGALCNNFAPKA